MESTGIDTSAPAPSWPTASGDPVVLDPDFHESVWTPWERSEAGASPGPAAETFDVTGHPVAAASADAPLEFPGPRGRVSRVGMVSAVAGALVLVAALTIPQLHTPTGPSSPLVADMMTQPEIAWSVDAGESCSAELDEDHAIMSTTRRVWSLDLRTGRTEWSVDLPGDTETVNCLPGADLVAVTDIDRFEDSVTHISLLDGSTGAKVSELPGESTVQVIPLGPNIGLIDGSNMLRAVTPGELDEPLWSIRLPGTGDDLGEVTVTHVDDTTVQLWYSLGQEALTPLLSLVDGQAPPWTQMSLTHEQYYERLGDVVLWHRGLRQASAFAVLDLDGRELWSREDEEPVISGSRLYTVSVSESGLQELREVDPGTGAPVDDDAYTGYFDYAFPAPRGGVAVFNNGSLMILDDHLQVQGTPLTVDHGETHVGQKLLYTGGHMYQDDNTRRTRLTAIDPSGSRPLWDFFLEPGQHVKQLGRHLVVLDNGGRTIHGLRGDA